MAEMDGKSRPDGSRLLHARPPLASQYSNSVPSTPHQHARDFHSRSRSPSPHGPLGSHSPRSVVSEANGSLRKSGRPSLPCKHEKPLPGRKRRIPYGTGEESLEKVKPEPKAALTPEEEAKLESSMQELYNRLLPSEESNKSREQLVQKLEKILHEEWPDQEFKVHMFGSSGNKLCTSDSDVDICIETSFKQLESVHDLAEAMYKRRMRDVICVAGAKIPIVKFEDPELKLKCDLNVNTITSLENTRMIKTYVEIDERVRPLAMIIKHWTTQRALHEAFNGVLNTYTWICLIINFLQTRNPPILPALHEMPHGEKSLFADDIEKLRGFGKENKETLAQLLFNFFRWYGHEVNYEESVISVRTGRLMSRAEKNWDLRSLTAEARQRLCVEEPFFTERNIGYTADNESFKGIHLEIRQAFSSLADGARLDKCCEAWVEETHVPLGDSGLFQKPTAAPRPVLTSASGPSPRAGRNGPGGRGGRANGNQRSNQSSRRNSSSANYGNGRMSQLPSPGLISNPLVNPQYIHELLVQRYMALGFERQQMESMLRATQIHPQTLQQVFGTPVQTSPMAGSPHQSQFVGGQPSPRLAEAGLANGTGVPGYLFHYPSQYDQSQTQSAQSATQEGFRTNPNSPTLSARAPVAGRDPQRTSTNGGIPNGSVRSHSQPARAVGNQQHAVYSPVLLQEAFRNASRTATMSSAEFPQHFPAYDLSLRSGRGYSMSGQIGEYGPPREYLGYSIGESPRMGPQQHQDLNFAPNPPFLEETKRPSRGSPDLVPPIPQYGLGHSSRSPSPLRHSRSFSAAGVHFGPIPQNSGLRATRLDSVQHAGEGGLLLSGTTLPQQLQSLREQASAENVPSPIHGNANTASTTPPPGATVEDPEPLSLGSASQHPNGDIWQPEQPSQPVIANGSAAFVRSELEDPWALPERKLVPEPIPQSRSHTMGESHRSPQTSPKSHTTINGNIAQHDLHLRTPHEGVLTDKMTLSPVEEARTPSPTASRRHQHTKNASTSVLSSMADHKVNLPRLAAEHRAASTKLSQTGSTATQEPGAPTNGTSPLADRLSHKVANSPASATTQTNGWQQQTSKRSGRKRAKSGPSQKVLAAPVDESERKGG